MAARDRHESSLGRLWVPSVKGNACLYCLNCTKFGQLILRKIIKTIATRCKILRLKCTKFDFRWGTAPDPAGGAYNAPQTPKLELRRNRKEWGTGGERNGEWGEKGEEGREIKRRMEQGRGKSEREWEGRDRTWDRSVGKGKEEGERKGGEGLQPKKLQFLAPPLLIWTPIS